MKRFNILLSAIFGGMLLSCTDGLDIKPTGELESEYFETELRIQEGVGACYATLSNMYGALLGIGAGIHEILLLPGDDVTHQDASHGTFEAFAGLNSSTGQVATLQGYRRP